MSSIVKTMLDQLKWCSRRTIVIYFALFILILSCVDLKTVEMRTKIRLLNGIRPDFTELNSFSSHRVAKQSIQWTPYKKYFELVSRFVPQDPIAKTLLGYVYYYTKDEDKAIALFKSAAEESQDLFWANYNLGVIYYKKGRYEEALEYMNRAVSAHPEGTVSAMYSSVIYRQIFASTSTTNLRTQVANAFGLAYIIMEASLEHLQKFDQLWILSAAAISNKDLAFQDAHTYYAGIACLQLNQIDKAVFLFQRSITLEKNNFLPYLQLARIYKVLGKELASQELLKLTEQIRLSHDERFPYDQKIELRYL